MFKPTLIFDLNDTLIYRSPSKISTTSYTKYENKFIYPRPGAQKLLETLSKNFTIHILTSMMDHNAEACLRAISPEYRQWVTLVMARDYNRPDPARKQGGKKWDTIRDMVKIWDKISPANDKTTIFIDNEARKYVDAPRNCLIIPDITDNELITGDSTVTDTLIEYFGSMRNTLETVSDLRLYLETVPFKIALPSNPIDLLQRAGINIVKSTLYFEYLDEMTVHMTDHKAGLKVTIKLPLPPGVRVEKKILLTEFLKIPVNRQIVITSTRQEMDLKM